MAKSIDNYVDDRHQHSTSYTLCKQIDANTKNLWLVERRGRNSTDLIDFDKIERGKEYVFRAAAAAKNRNWISRSIGILVFSLHIFFLLLNGNTFRVPCTPFKKITKIKFSHIVSSKMTPKADHCKWAQNKKNHSRHVIDATMVNELHYILPVSYISRP